MDCSGYQYVSFSSLPLTLTGSNSFSSCSAGSMTLQGTQQFRQNPRRRLTNDSKVYTPSSCWWVITPDSPICSEGVMTQARNTASPLQGMISVAISMPNIPMSPGPTMVSMPLSFTPSRKNSAAMLHRSSQKTPAIFTRQSTSISSMRVGLKPWRSQREPQRGAPTTAEIVTRAEQQERKWSSLMMGMQSSLTLRTRQIRQTGSNPQMKKISRKRGSLRLVTRGEGLCYEIEETARYASEMGSTYTRTVLEGSGMGASCFLVTKNDPSKLIPPATRQTLFEAEKTLSETSRGKMGMPFSSTVAGRLSGLTSCRKTRFQVIMPTLNMSTASPLILLRCLGNCVQRQLMTGMAPRQKQLRGRTSQKRVKVHLVKVRFIIRGERVKRRAQSLREVLQPSRRARGLEARTAKHMGRRPRMSRRELVLGSMVSPWCLRAEQKQMLLVPQVTERPVANLMRQPPMRVRVAGRSAYRSMAIIETYNCETLLIMGQEAGGEYIGRFVGWQGVTYVRKYPPS